MIPLPNREKLLKLVREGSDIRNACKESEISKSSLYRYFAEFPSYKKEVYDAMDAHNADMLKRAEKKEKEMMENLKKMIVLRNKL